MQVFINRATRRLQNSVADSRQLTQLTHKRGDAETLEIFFVENGVQQELASGSVVSYGVKKLNKYDSDVLIFEDDFDLEGSGSTAKYVAAVSLNTVPLNAEFEIDEDEDNDPPYLDLMGEITWTDGPGGDVTSTETFFVRVHNDVLRGDEDDPSSLPDPDEWMPAPIELDRQPYNEGEQFARATVTVTTNNTGAWEVTDNAFISVGESSHTFASKEDKAAFIATLIDAENDFLFEVQKVDGAVIHLKAKTAGAGGNSLGLGVSGVGMTSSGELFTDGGPGDLADQLGQQAIASTSNDSGDFEDVWTCSHLSPTRWQPPGQITKSPNGTLYRAIVDNSGIPSTELAYP